MKKRKREPKPAAAKRPQPPSHLDPVARNEWRRVVPELIDIGVLARVDTATLAAYCQAYSRWVKAELELQAHGTLTYVSETGVIRLHPAVGAAEKAMAQVRLFAQEYGLTPASRARVQAHIDGEEDEEEDDILD